MPVSVREQMNVLVQIVNINSKTVQFLFPDLDPSGIVIPIGKGTGLIQVIDNEHPYTKLPKEHQAQKMLKEVVSEIKEEVSNAYPEYLISGFERHGNSLWLKGTRK